MTRKLWNFRYAMAISMGKDVSDFLELMNTGILKYTFWFWWMANQ
jgi:hypothetical protein